MFTCTVAVVGEVICSGFVTVTPLEVSTMSRAASSGNDPVSAQVSKILRALHSGRRADATQCNRDIGVAVVSVGRRGVPGRLARPAP